MSDFFKTSLATRLDMAGSKLSPGKMKRQLFFFSVLVTAGFVFYIYRNLMAAEIPPETRSLVTTLTLSAIGIFIGANIVLRVAANVLLDLAIYKRTRSVEEVLPDFLQLTATNVRAGMTIDRALWLAIRPRFGILAHEIETVAKEVMSGAELTDSLKKFADKYDSDMLKRTINLLIEGINAGSEIGDLLNRTSQNIQEVRTIQKEMAASVTSYSIFITFASIVASPVLMALSKQLIVIISGISGNIGTVPSSSVISLNTVGVTAADFHLFAIVSTCITALCSSFIIAIINKGNIKEGVNYIPSFLLIALILYFLADKILGVLLTGFF